MSNEYKKQAQAFLDQFQLTLEITQVPRRPPPWHEKDKEYGRKYEIVLQRKGDSKGPGMRFIRFPFWDSIHNKKNDIKPTPYDVLACLSGGAAGYTDPDEVYREYGEMLPSEAIRIANFTKRLQRFFSEAELNELQEIQ